MQIADACKPYRRNPDDITIVGVTKYFDHSAIVAAVRDGIRHIGENRPMDVRDKFPLADAAIAELLGPDVHYTKHMIGHLQRNKVKVTLEQFDMIQTLDSIVLAEEVQKQAEKLGDGPVAADCVGSLPTDSLGPVLADSVGSLPTDCVGPVFADSVGPVLADGVGPKLIDCLIELKLSDEESKTGLNPAALDQFVAALKRLDRLRILGVMGMPPYFPDPDQTRPYFRRLREAFERLKFHETDRFQMRYLSMGMSHDFTVAVEEGANMVRIGQALFE